MRTTLTLIAVHALIVRSALAQCDSTCSPIGALVDSCHLPPLSSDYTQFHSVLRNVTGVPENLLDGGNGPLTAILANYDQARCLCTTARTEFVPCLTCLTKARADSGNYYQMLDFYHVECNRFGYFKNDTFGSPSTTVTTTPLSTPTTASRTQACGIIEGQLQQCNLLGLNQIDKTPLFYDDEIETSLLHNRTSGQCFCTLPVMRTLTSCFYADSNSTQKSTLIQYQNDCNAQGYWTDGQEVIPSDPFHLSSSSSSSSATSSTSTPRSTSAPGAQNSQSIKIGLDYRAIVPALVVASFLLGAIAL